MHSWGPQMLAPGALLMPQIHCAKCIIRAAGAASRRLLASGRCRQRDFGCGQGRHRPCDVTAVRTFLFFLGSKRLSFFRRAMCSMSVTDRLHWQLRFEELILKSQTLIQSPPLGGRLARRGPKATQSGLLQRVAIRAGSCPETRAPQHMVHLVTAAEPGAATLLAPVVETLSERCPSVVSIVRSDAAAAAAQPQQRRRRDREPRGKPTRGSDTEVGATESATCHWAMLAGRALP